MLVEAKNVNAKSHSKVSKRVSFKKRNVTKQSAMYEERGKKTALEKNISLMQKLLKW